jgi:hypothetical protein
LKVIFIFILSGGTELFGWPVGVTRILRIFLGLIPVQESETLVVWILEEDEAA